MKKGMNRRGFMKSAAAAGAGLGLGSAVSAQETTPPRKGKSVAGFRVNAGHIAGIGVAVGVAVFYIVQQNKFVAVVN